MKPDTVSSAAAADVSTWRALAMPAPANAARATGGGSAEMTAKQILVPSPVATNVCASRATSRVMIIQPLRTDRGAARMEVLRDLHVLDDAIVAGLEGEP